MSKTRLLLAGTGGYGRSVVESDQLSGQFEVVGFLGDSLPAGKALQGVSCSRLCPAWPSIVPRLTKPF